MNAADSVRLYTERSNQLHQQYLEDPVLLERYARFVNWQLSYMLPFYQELRQAQDTRAAIDFIISDLAGIGISQRDQEIQRVVPAMVRMLPTKALATLASAMQLNARILEINLAICRVYNDGYSDVSTFTERNYCIAARQAVSLSECLELVQLTKKLGHNLQHITHIPLLGATLKAMRIPARLAGFGALQSFLEKGYSTFRNIESVEQFLDAAELKMQQLFERVYTKPLHELQQ